MSEGGRFSPLISDVVGWIIVVGTFLAVIIVMQNGFHRLSEKQDAQNQIISDALVRNEKTVTQIDHNVSSQLAATNQNVQKVGENASATAEKVADRAARRSPRVVVNRTTEVLTLTEAQARARDVAVKRQAQYEKDRAAWTETMKQFHKRTRQE